MVETVEPAKSASMRELGVAQRVDYKGYGSTIIIPQSSSIYNIRKQTKGAAPMNAAQKKHEVLGKLMMATKALEKDHVGGEHFGQNAIFALSLIKDSISLVVELELDEIKQITA